MLWSKNAHETPRATAVRLIASCDGSRTEALLLVRDRLRVHAPTGNRAIDAKRSPETFARWQNVGRWLLGQLTGAERRALGLPLPRGRSRP
jgi:hypothetical protein